MLRGTHGDQVRREGTDDGGEQTRQASPEEKRQGAGTHLAINAEEPPGDPGGVQGIRDGDGLGAPAGLCTGGAWCGGAEARGLRRISIRRLRARNRDQGLGQSPDSAGRRHRRVGCDRGSRATEGLGGLRSRVTAQWSDEHRKTHVEACSRDSTPSGHPSSSSGPGDLHPRARSSRR